MTNTEIVDRRIVTDDGVSLAATLFVPAGETKFVVIVNSAMAVARGFYRHFAAYLAAHGSAAITYDYRGIGDSLSGHPRADCSRLYQWGEHDLGAVIDAAENEFSGARIVVAGRSVGSQIVGLSPSAKKLAAFIVISAQSGYWKNWSGRGRAVMFSLWHLVLPVTATVAGFVPGFLVGSKTSLPRRIALDWASLGRDPLYIRGRHRRASDVGFDRFDAPILAWHVSDDPYAPRKALDALLDFYPRASIEVRTATPALAGVETLGHFGWFRPAGGTPFWDETCAWIAALP